MAQRPILVIGATGDVGSGIVKVLLHSGHKVIASSRRQSALEELAASLSTPGALRLQAGSVESDECAEKLAGTVGDVGAVIVSVNFPRKSVPLIDLESDELSERVNADLITHFAAARTFLPRLPKNGVYIGIGGGSADFILTGGIYMSMAQAALRMMYRGLAAELGASAPHLKELIVASVVNSRSTREGADPAWVTDEEIGALVEKICDNPENYPGAVWRIARRDETGVPIISREDDLLKQAL